MDAVRAFVLAYFAANPAVYHPAQIQAIDRYIERESRYDYTVEASSGACLFQWAGSRRRRITHGGACPPLRYQLRYADWEMRSPTFRCFLYARSPGEAYAILRYTFGRGNAC